MEKGAVFPLFYLPSIEYFSKILKHKDNLLIENAENFRKQSYRNRAIIHSPNGALNLIVPVIKGSKNHTLVKDVRISYDFKWQRQHLMSLQTSYSSSAYFEYYEDDLTNFYEKKWDFLFDYNEDLLRLLNRILKINIRYNYTNSFETTYPELDDYRESLHPKYPSDISLKPYFQVFEERNGFLPNLSIVDLLFNQGPQSIKYL
ncbi:WbqC family protein [Daejeonella sp.]|uniref:WbqC family protein n=1 Tax=Daejeonella sp. TaxID=2805397 RepID=UPI0027286B63|nr:WbqC family protein [Daejeonella sp.]MDO8992005.1 WbqC family protein [Daejeonella sp.]MDP2413638.1 WbqC family protein [Daejeonella sp.]